ncbi:MAG: hypothetical protein Q8P56_00090 [Candidatus Uhrbacteria bacterium]|nr:hypothetical protein [Candidatus Uhrbacteria bacterium]
MNESTPSYDRVRAEECARVLQGEVRKTEHQLRQSREAARTLVEQLFGFLSEKTQKALMHSFGEKDIGFISSNLYRNAVNNFYDLKNKREPLNPGFQTVFEIDGNHFKNMSEIEGVIEELKDRWSGIVDVSSTVSPENNTTVVSFMLVRS